MLHFAVLTFLSSYSVVVIPLQVVAVSTVRTVCDISILFQKNRKILK